ncbi:hypothetical protein GPX89_34495 [Nocardia sp. ET3-3]|uniref:Uncharacterized protein n=1 Tax=Nocardia terrae TaxID=2675851 RepID=A0A7K1V7A2_9NOCA|nr:hypothetical protein [Nocardia terrae]MVU82332.1 hypothetical protein [Nocardia terrae]
MTVDITALQILDSLRRQSEMRFGTPIKSTPEIVQEIDSILRGMTNSNAELLEFLDRKSASLRDEERAWRLTQAHIEDELRLAGGMLNGIEKPLVGCLQTGQLNMVSMRTPSGGHLILVERDLDLFCWKLAKAVAYATYFEGQDVFPSFPINAKDEAGGGILGGFSALISGDNYNRRLDRIIEDPQFSRHFCDLIVTYAVTGDTRRVSGRPLDWRDSQDPVILFRSMEYFLVGHEYGHLCCRHFDEANRRKGVLPCGEDEVYECGWKQEIQADFFGADIALSLGGTHASPVREGVTGTFEREVPFHRRLTGVATFLMGIQTMDLAISVLETGSEEFRKLGTHPDPVLRLDWINKYVDRKAEENPAFAEMVRAAIIGGRLYGQIIARMWDHVRPVVLDLHRQGVRPAPTWRSNLK